MQLTTGGIVAASKVSPSRARAGTGPTSSAVIDDQNEFVVGLLVPINGSAGIWGPSSIACAQLAQAEINADGGLLDRRLRLRVIDSSDEALEVGHVTGELMRSGAIDAIVGMHTSQVRQRVLRDVARQIPYVYTPLYEGGELHARRVRIGRDAGPAVAAGDRAPDEALSRSALDVHRQRLRVAARVAPARGALRVSTVAERCWPIVTLPFGVEDHSELLDEIRRLRPDAILLSLVGQDAVNFNRAFGRCGCCRATCSGLSCAIEENGLLAIRADNTDGLFVSSGYFASLDNDSNMAFKERYYNHFGQRAPTLNSLGQSTYEGMHFMAALARRAAEGEAPLIGPLATPLPFRSVRGTRYLGNDQCLQPTYLAEARGHFFQAPVAL